MFALCCLGCGVMCCDVMCGVVWCYALVVVTEPEHEHRVQRPERRVGSEGA